MQLPSVALDLTALPTNRLAGLDLLSFLAMVTLDLSPLCVGSPYPCMQLKPKRCLH